MDNSSFPFSDRLIMSVTLSVLAVGGCAHLLSRAACRRDIADTPLVRIRSAAQGYVKLSGQARPHSGLVQGYLSGQPCVWYRYSIVEVATSDNDTDSEVARGGCANLIVLDDGSGQCIVDLAGADVRPRQTRQWTGPHRDPNSPTPVKWYQSSKRYRYYEEWIDVDETLFCLGHLTTPPHEPARLAVAGDVWRQPTIVFAGDEKALAVVLGRETSREIWAVVTLVLLALAAILSLFW